MQFVLAFVLAAQDAAPESPPWFTNPIFMFTIIALLAYLLLMRPAQRQEQQRREMMSRLKKNDKVVNQGGIIGVIDSLKDKEDEVILKGGIHITKSSIVRVLGDEAAKD